MRAAIETVSSPSVAATHSVALHPQLRPAECGARQCLAPTNAERIFVGVAFKPAPTAPKWRVLCEAGVLKRAYRPKMSFGISPPRRTTAMHEPAQWTLAEASAHLHKRTISALELTKACLAQISLW